MKRETINILKFLWGIAFILGVIGVVQKFTTGERLAGYGSYVPWGLWVAVYFHAIGISGGVFAVGVIGYLANIKGLRENLPLIIWISMTSLMTGMVAIWLDLGKMWRFYRILTDPSFTSMLAFNAWMYVFLLITAGICLYLNKHKVSSDAINDRSGWLVPLLITGISMSIAYPSQSGALFGVVNAKPYWNSALLPIMFLASAVASGSAALLLVNTFIVSEKLSPQCQPMRYLRSVTIGAVIAYLIAEFSEFSVSFWGPTSHGRESLELILFGPFWWVFWIVHLGGAIGGLILLLKKSVSTVGTGAFLVVFTFITTRLNILIPGQAVAELRGLGEAFSHQRLGYYYQATQNEYLVALFLGALGVGLVYLGIKKLIWNESQEVNAS